MRSTGARIALAVAAIAAVVVLFIVLSGDDDDSSSNKTTATSTATTETQTQTQTTEVDQPEVIVVKNGQPQGGVNTLEYTKGDRVRLVVRSDVADEVHIHGYDLSQDVSAGGSVRFNFSADIEGVFEIELEERKEQIAKLRVSPS